MPLIGLPIMCQFPAALNLYWLTTNLISIAQTQLIRHPSLRSSLGIGELIKWKQEDLPLGQGGFSAFSVIAEDAKEKKEGQEKMAKKQVTDNEIDLKMIEARVRKELEKEWEEKQKAKELEKESEEKKKARELEKKAGKS